MISGAVQLIRNPAIGRGVSWTLLASTEVERVFLALGPHVQHVVLMYLAWLS